MSVIWHDLECGRYSEDLELWRSLAEEHGDPILDVGAGTGRITLDLARRGHHVVALDTNEMLLAELSRRAEGLPVETVVGDARDFALEERFALCLVPMQTIQLLGGKAGRQRFLRCARGHLTSDGVLAVAIASTLDLYDAAQEAAMPLPDICELDGIVYSSQPTAVRSGETGFVLERRREVVTRDGERSVSRDTITLDHLGAEQLCREGAEAGFQALGSISIPATRDYAGSEVVMLAG